MMFSSTPLGGDASIFARSLTKTKQASFTALALGFLTLFGGTVEASSLLPAAVAPYNVFVTGNFSEGGADTGGRLAVGGNASFSNTYAITQSLLENTSAPDTLIVAGKVLSGTANVQHGNASIGSNTGGGSVSVPNGTLSVGPSPIDFAATEADLVAYSAYLSQLDSTGTVNNNGFGTITLTGTSSTLNVFNIDAALLGGNNTININDPSGSTVLINVIGTSLTTTNAGIKVNGHAVNGNDTSKDVDNVLFNFYQATSITLNGGFLGSILAPSAAVIGTGNQQVDGQLIAGSFSGNTEFHDYLFTGQYLPTSSSPNLDPIATPEPASLAMLGAGLVILGITRRRLRK